MSKREHRVKAVSEKFLSTRSRTYAGSNGRYWFEVERGSRDGDPDLVYVAGSSIPLCLVCKVIHDRGSVYPTFSKGVTATDRNRILRWLNLEDRTAEKQVAQELEDLRKQIAAKATRSRTLNTLAPVRKERLETPVSNPHRNKAVYFSREGETQSLFKRKP